MIDIYKNDAILKIIDIADKAGIDGYYVDMDRLRERAKEFLSDSIVLYYRFIPNAYLDENKPTDRDIFLSSKCDAHIAIDLSRPPANKESPLKCYAVLGYSAINNSAEAGKAAIAYQTKIVSLVEEIESFLLICNFIDP